MEAMRQSWTDDRLDDFRGEVNRRFDEARDETNRRFDEVNRRFDEAREETKRSFNDAAVDVNRRFDEVSQSLGQIDRRFESFDDRFAAMQRTIMITGGGMIAALVAGILGLIGIALF